MIRPGLGGRGGIRPGLGSARKVAGGAPSIVYDTFTGVNGTDLTLHDPDIDTIGTGWVLRNAGPIEIQDNLARGIGTSGNRSIYDIDIGVDSGFVLSVDFEWYRSGLLASIPMGVLIRNTDADNGIAIGFTASALIIADNNNASWDQFASIPAVITAGVIYHIEVTVTGNLIEVDIDDGTYTLSTTTAEHVGATNVGIICYRNRAEWDNFLVEPI